MAASEIPENIASIAAPVLLGYMLNWGLYGILTVQVYIYYMAFPNDRRAYKCVVYGLYMIDTVQSIIVAHDAFNAYARGFGDLVALDSMQTEWLATPILTGIVSCVVQLCYTYRISLLSGSKILWIAISAIALMQGTAAIVAGVQALKVDRFSELAAKAFIATSIWLCGSAVCDVVIAACMTFILVRRDTGMDSTHALVSKLVRLIVETGCLTAATAIIDVVLFLALPHRSYHACVALLLAKFYSNSLLAVFNSRIHITNGRNGQSTSQRSFISFKNVANKIPEALSFDTSGVLAVRPTHEGIRVRDESWTDNIQLESQTSVGSMKPRSLSREV